MTKIHNKIGTTGKLLSVYLYRFLFVVELPKMYIYHHNTVTIHLDNLLDIIMMYEPSEFALLCYKYVSITTKSGFFFFFSVLLQILTTSWATFFLRVYQLKTRLTNWNTTDTFIAYYALCTVTAAAHARIKRRIPCFTKMTASTININASV